MPSVPHGEIERYTGEETGFGDSKLGINKGSHVMAQSYEDTADEEIFEVFDYAGQGDDDTPREHDEGKPATWSPSFHNHVAERQADARET